MTAARADERPRDDAPHVVRTAHHLSRDCADAPELFDRNDLLVRRDLKNGIGGRVDDRIAGAHVLLAELIEDDGARRRLVAECFPPDSALVLGDHIRWKSV